MYYVSAATSQLYVSQAIQSAISIKEWDPDAHYTLYTVIPCTHPVIDTNIILPLQDTNLKTHKALKQKAIYYTLRDIKPSHMIWMDTDTTVHDNIQKPWNCSFDIAIALDNYREEALIPFNYPNNIGNYHNTGIIYFRNNPKTLELSKKWLEMYETYSHHLDQPALNTLINNPLSTLEKFILPPEYNARLNDLTHVSGTVKIIHRHTNGHGNLNEHLAKNINTLKGPRIWDPITKETTQITWNPNTNTTEKTIHPYKTPFNPHWYIFHWPKPNQSTLELTKKLDRNNYPYTIISSETKPFSTLENKTICLGHNSLMSMFNTMIEHFTSFPPHAQLGPSTHAIHLQADIDPFSVKKLHVRLRNAIKYNLGIYTTDTQPKDIKHSNAKNIGNGYWETDESDCTVWAINGDLIRKGPPKFPSQYEYGWGIDWYYCHLAQHYQKKIILDREMEITHHPGRSYPGQKALRDYRALQGSFPIDKNGQATQHPPYQNL